MKTNRIEKARQQVSNSVRSLAEAKENARAALARLASAMDSPRVNLRRLAYAAYEASRKVSLVWTESTWLAESRRDLARTRAGKRPTYAPIWLYPGDALRAKAKGVRA